MSSILSQLNFSGRPRLPVIRQTEAAECGLACLAMIAGFHGHEIDLNTLRRRYPVSLKGASLKAIMTTADHLDLATRALRVDLEALGQLSLPAVLHWDLNHFVVLKSVRGKTIEIHDPARGERRMTLAEASPHFTGVALELTPTKAFERREEVSRMKLTDLWSRSAGIGRAILQTLILSALLQIVALAAHLCKACFALLAFHQGGFHVDIGAVEGVFKLPDALESSVIFPISCCLGRFGLCAALLRRFAQF